jgi:hypothetical protein
VKPIKFALVALFALGALAFATPAYASSVTQTGHGVTIPLGPSGCSQAPGDLMITGNGVIHDNSNSTGDWFTETIEGTATITDPVTGATQWSGRATAWEGSASNNNGNVGVLHFTGDGHGTLADGTSLSFHVQAQLTFTHGVTTVSNMTETCR